MSDLYDEIDPAGVAGVEPQRDPRVQSYVRLASAVLQEVFLYRKRTADSKARGKRLRPRETRWLEQDRQWLLDDDDSYPFSFVSICLTLGLSPDAVRRKYLWQQKYLHG